MVCKVSDYKSGASGMVLSNPICQIIGFAARTSEQHVPEFFRQGRQQRFSVIEYALVEVARMGIECRGLFRKSRHYMGVTVTHHGHIVVSVQKPLAACVEEPDTFAAHD